MFLLLISVLILSCKNNTKQIVVFFNPARALHVTKMNFKIEFNNEVMLDTSVTNNFVDKNLYMGEFKIETVGNDVLLIRVNNKSLQIKHLDTLPSCSNIFASYDNFTLLLDEASRIEKRKTNKGLSVDYKLIVDSLKKSAQTADRYDRVEFFIKPGKCKD